MVMSKNLKTFEEVVEAVEAEVDHEVIALGIMVNKVRIGVTDREEAQEDVEKEDGDGDVVVVVVVLVVLAIQVDLVVQTMMMIKATRILVDLAVSLNPTLVALVVDLEVDLMGILLEKVNHHLATASHEEGAEVEVVEVHQEDLVIDVMWRGTSCEIALNLPLTSITPLPHLTVVVLVSQIQEALAGLEEMMKMLPRPEGGLEAEEEEVLQEGLVIDVIRKGIL